MGKRHCVKELEPMKVEIAAQLGIDLDSKNLTSQDAGKVGGHMVRRLMALAIQKYDQGPSM